MLLGALGIRLILLVGRTIPLPAPYSVTSTLTDLSVTNDADGPDGFQLTLTVGKTQLLDYGLASDGTFAPLTRVVIAVLMGAIPEVLLDGVVTNHELSPSNEPGKSTLSVTGKDLTQVMDLEERDDKYENQPDFLIFTSIVGRYARYGLVPDPRPTTDVPLMLDWIPSQQGTDLQFVRELTERNGFVFYVEPVTFGVNRAYFGPEIRAGLPQPALTMNMGPATNVSSLSFSNDALAPVATTGTFVVPYLKIAVPIPPLPSLRIPPLVSSPAPAVRTVRLRDTSNESPGRAAATAVAAVTRAPEAVTADGTVDSVRYGSVLRARGLVGVRGVGISYDGFYYVRRVTHTIRRGEYTQSFSLSREGTGPLLPVVRP